MEWCDPNNMPLELAESVLQWTVPKNEEEIHNFLIEKCQFTQGTEIYDTARKKLSAFLEIMKWIQGKTQEWESELKDDLKWGNWKESKKWAIIEKVENNVSPLDVFWIALDKIVWNTIHEEVNNLNSGKKDLSILSENYSVVSLGSINTFTYKAKTNNYWDIQVILIKTRKNSESSWIKAKITIKIPWYKDKEETINLAAVSRIDQFINLVFSELKYSSVDI